MANSWSEVVKEATFEANDSHVRLQTKLVGEQASSVDIFSIIERDKIVLMFQPLGSLAGAYIPSQGEGVPPGILLNEKLPLPKQRYSAAHEYCHHIRNDPFSTDTENELFDYGKYKRSDSERIAESFAACFLMPRVLVKTMISRMGLEVRNIQAEHAYNLSLRLGTSYTATVNQLYSLRFITEKQRAEIIGIQPKQIKEGLGTEGIESTWNDVWRLTRHDHGEVLQPRPGDLLQVELEENPTTGYIWTSEKNECLELISRQWYPEDEMIGAGGKRSYTFKAIQEGHSTLEFLHKRPWSEDHSIDLVQYYLSVQSKRHGVAERLLTG